MVKGTKNHSFDPIFAGSNPSVLVDKSNLPWRRVKIALTDSDTRSAFFTPDSPTNEPIIISDESEEEEVETFAELKNIQWELPAEFLALPHLVSSVQEKLKTLDSLPSLLKKVTNTLNRFSTLVENASGAITMGVPSADKAIASPAKGEKDPDTNLKMN
ncbi:hypothetical protein Tco_0889587 [Tanacetum coccineum]